MLEAIRQRAQGWFAKALLLLIAVTFALWGVESYFRSGGTGDAIAKVDGRAISEREFDRVLKDQLDSMGPQADRAIAEDPKFRKAVLERLINQHLIADHAAGSGMVVSAEQIRKAVQEIPAFQDERGAFSSARFQQVLRNRGMAPEQFEAMFREELLIGQARAGVMASAFVPKAVVERLVKSIEERREISLVTLPRGEFLSRAGVTPREARAYYTAHAGNFRVPEQVRVEYVELSAIALGQQAAISAADVQSFYEQNASRYAEPEQRRASHILVRIPEGASAAVKTQVRAKAEAILAEVGKTPERFGDIARAKSEDPGSAPSGGDLGFNPRGAMVKPFDDAVFAMKDNEVRGLVESQFGFHIIRLTGVQPARTRTLESVRGDIGAELKRQHGMRQFAEAAEQLANLAYEQPQTLKPAADALKIEIRGSDWITSKGMASGAFSNRKLLDAVFGSDSLREHHNTEPVEVAPNDLVVARVVDHRPAATQSFETVEADLTQKLKEQKAAQLAEAEGKATVERLRRGDEPKLGWGAFQVLNRNGGGVLAAQAITEVFRADPAHLPAYRGFAGADGSYSIVRITRVIEPAAMDQAKAKEYARQLAEVASARDLSAYVAGLRARASVKIVEDRLVKKQ